jgi:hypothetical protein
MITIPRLQLKRPLVAAIETCSSGRGNTVTQTAEARNELGFNAFRARVG